MGDYPVALGRMAIGSIVRSISLGVNLATPRGELNTETLVWFQLGEEDGLGGEARTTGTDTPQRVVAENENVPMVGRTRKTNIVSWEVIG